MSRRGLLRFGLLALACGVGGCGDTGGSTATPSGKAASESGSLGRIERLKERMKAGDGKKK